MRRLASAQYQAVNAARRPSRRVSTPCESQAARWARTEDASCLLEDRHVQQHVQGEEEECQVKCEEEEDKGDGRAECADQHDEGEDEPGHDWIWKQGIRRRVRIGFGDTRQITHGRIQ